MGDYELGDYLLIRNDRVLAVSANEQFSDGEHPIAPQQSDTIVAVVSGTAQVVETCPTCGTIIEDESWGSCCTGVRFSPPLPN